VKHLAWWISDMLLFRSFCWSRDTRKLQTLHHGVSLFTASSMIQESWSSRCPCCHTWFAVRRHTWCC